MMRGEVVVIGRQMLVAVLFLIFPVLSLADDVYPGINEIEKDKLQVITEYMGLLHADVLVRSVIANEIARMRSDGVEISVDTENKLTEVFSDPKVIVAMYAPMYSKHLSMETLTEAVTFLKSEVGQKSIEHLLGGKKGSDLTLTDDEVSKIKSFYNSDAWNEIKTKTPYITQDASSFSHFFIAGILNGEIRP